MDNLSKEKERINQIQNSQEQYYDNEENVKKQNLSLQPWVNDFIGNTLNSQEETQRTQLIDATTQVFVKQNRQKERDIDPTSERTNKLERERFLERNEDFVGPELNEKEVIGCSRVNDQEVEVETQRFAILAQHACEAAETALIFGDVREVTLQILNVQNATRIIAGDAQQRSEIALVADHFKDIFGMNASVYKVLGEQSMLAIREQAKIAEILAESQIPIDLKQQTFKQQPQEIQAMFPNMYTQQSGNQFKAR
ncbi:MAG: hypothetical protein EZS28_012111 [Streblomastix strix]|uniref:Uncharacterized protein n=1 Tax=Streblomastix strix TaxID=222440 RepID=A0A5J4WBQ0_9EUKA|nr:MAG: hypothetical protein EZS28_012111 [Streblomastix strix]